MAIFLQKTDMVASAWENVETAQAKSPHQCRKVGRRQKKTARRERISPGGNTFLPFCPEVSRAEWQIQSLKINTVSPKNAALRLFAFPPCAFLKCLDTQPQ